MKRTLYLHDILDFHPLGQSLQHELGVRLFQVVINDYVGHCLPSGNPYLINPSCPESYIATLLEGLPGFPQLSVVQSEQLIREAVLFFHSFLDHLERLQVSNQTTVTLYPADDRQTRVALVV